MLLYFSLSALWAGRFLFVNSVLNCIILIPVIFVNCSIFFPLFCEMQDILTRKVISLKNVLCAVLCYKSGC